MGLSYLHQKNIVHRDLKPGNIFFSSSEQMFPIKIGDFGLSRVTGDGNVVLKKAGTVKYMAPDPICGKSSDIYSLGLVISEVIRNVDGKETVTLSPLLEASNISDLMTAMTKKDLKKRLSSLQSVFLVGDGVKPENSAQLLTCLEVFGPNSKILLLPGTEYKGNFIMTNDGISLTGAETEPRPSLSNECGKGNVLTIKGRDCIVSNFKIATIPETDGSALCIHGTGNKINNLFITGTNEDIVTGVSLRGDSNTMSNTHIKSFAEGLSIHGKKHQLGGVDLENCTTGIRIEAESISLRNIRCSVSSVGLGIMAGCKDVSLVNMEMIGAPSDYEGACLIEAMFCSGLSIDGLICKGEILTGLSLNNCDNTIISNCFCESVEVLGCTTDEEDNCDTFVDGKECHNKICFKNVDFGKSIWVSGCAKGVRFTNCKGIELIDHTKEGYGPQFGKENNFKTIKRENGNSNEIQLGALQLATASTSKAEIL